MAAAPGGGEGVWSVLYGDRDTLGVSPAEPLGHTADQNLPGLILTYPTLCLSLIPLISEGSFLINVNRT